MYRIEDGYVYKAIAHGDDKAVMKVGPSPGGGLQLELVGVSANVDVRDRLIAAAPANVDVRDQLIAAAPANVEVRDQLIAAAQAYVREWFDLDRDLSPFYELASRDRLLQEPVQQFHGLRLMGIPDLFEALCWGIIGQQINLAFAYTLKRRLVEAYGVSVVAEGATHWLFPKPELIASLSVSDLEPMRMTVKKCEYLIGAAEAVASGALSKERVIGAGSLKEAEKLLTGMRGIGPWTAHYAIMRCLRLPDAFPIDDVGLHNAIKLQLGMDRKPTKPELVALSEGWSGWEAYATFYLWRLLY
ncbi:DNA-3-methyladenine glycosylase 2 family protein [Paenibacillus pinisoli]|uniref:DNA-3-methyladenine glycosylase II n=2 Tax=Paenibacillus pinisoli TaxID=1276110 RepID=A0A3A6PCT7_9BACL|nr:DNA-3-methyladenine glycosylase 2 family protein [Paenibacillus pinisoli]